MVIIEVGKKLEQLYIVDKRWKIKMTIKMQQSNKLYEGENKHIALSTSCMQSREGQP